MVTLLGAIAEILCAAADRARELEAEAEREHRDWSDQRSSPLGPRRHIRAVRRRVDAGLPGAAAIGQRYLLSREALAEEMQRPRHAEPVELTGRAKARETLRLLGR